MRAKKKDIGAGWLQTDLKEPCHEIDQKSNNGNCYKENQITEVSTKITAQNVNRR